MSKALFLVDSYLKKINASVVSVKDDKYVVLNQTIFYPKGGGQPYDTGQIIKDGKNYQVGYVGKFSGEISHEVNQAGLKLGDKVVCVLDWKRRYKLMRSHTAAHVFAALLHKETGALITGNQIEEKHVRIDFSTEKFDKKLLEKHIVKANKLFSDDISVKSYELPKEEALKIPGGIKMAGAFPPDLEKLRIVEITGLDKQLDGGTHVRNLQEIGRIELIKTVNKGKKNRRIYFKLD